MGLGLSTELSPDTAAVKALVPRALFCSHTGPGLRGPGIFSLCTRQVHGKEPSSPSPQFADLVCLCKVPGEKRWRSRKRQALAGEPDAGSLACSCHSSQLPWNLSGSSASSLLPPEKVHNSKVTRGHFAQAWTASLGCYTAPLPPPGTFSKLHPFCTKLFAE